MAEWILIRIMLADIKYMKRIKFGPYEQDNMNQLYILSGTIKCEQMWSESDRIELVWVRLGNAFLQAACNLLLLVLYIFLFSGHHIHVSLRLGLIEWSNAWF